MPTKSPYVIELTREEREELVARSKEYTSPYRDVVRAKIVLLASQGVGNDSIAARLDMPRQVVSKWRRRFYAERLPGLDERPRGGRPASSLWAQRADVPHIAGPVAEGAGTGGDHRRRGGGEPTGGLGRYSPGECVGAEKRRVEGKPDPAHISTSFAERSNLTMRMGNRRFTRLTNAFSKKAENHAHMVALHMMYYNFVRIHQTLRCTPAMAAGVTTKLWELADMVKVLEDWEAARGAS